MRSVTAVSRVAWVALSLIVITQAEPTSTFYSAINPCPASCRGKPANWTVYSSVTRLDVCDQPQLLDFALYNFVDDANSIVKISACTAGNANNTNNRMVPTKASVPICISNAKESKVSLNLFAGDSEGDASADHLYSALEQVQKYLADESNCDEKIIFGYAHGAAIGVYIGDAIDTSFTASSLLQRLRDEVEKGKAPSSAILQLCDDKRNADHTFGVAIDTTGNLAAVQKSVAAWNNATCVKVAGTISKLDDVSVLEEPLVVANNRTLPNNGTLPNNRNLKARTDLQKRNDCTTTTVVSGDSCGALASKCGISGSDFTKYNTNPNLCSTLAVGQRVCCSAGTLPDLTPKPNSDGSCARYTVKSGDTCSSIATANSLTPKSLSDLNDKITWGWFGCEKLLAGLTMCLSKGTQPMPAAIPNAICGPQVPNTKPPSPITADTLKDLNPCPLNSCCDIWGQCGITPEYCTSENGPTGNPGTAPPGRNGCISNCGTNITNNDVGPASFMSVGYYESWNWDRPCLNMRVNSVPTDLYTHIHWGFGTITSTFDVEINDTAKQWNEFLALTGVRRIVSFGGWGYSTEPATYNRLREAMNPTNVDTFANNIVSFISTTGLDGVDFDWEYPGALDIPGIPPGLKTDGPNYLHFLETLRNKLAASKSISIAAPASYWYLRSFPIANMSSSLDYIVYMTYDLHGQWDYGHQWSQEGCPGGNCLRSHVNSTETKYSLAMVTKAGVHSNKITVGVSSYGRSFAMTKADCTGPDCTYLGPESSAAKGQCTQTAGYISNAEIDAISLLNDTSDEVRTFYDAGSDSNFLVYNKTQWVAYMDDTTKTSRTNWYKGLNMAGTVDWAVDLQSFTGDDHNPAGDDNDELPATTPLSPCDLTFATVEDLEAASDSMPIHCRGQYTVGVLSSLLDATLKNYTDLINAGYDGKFTTYANAVAGSAGDTVHKFMNDNGNKYFSCIVPETTFCCSTCSHWNCKYCFDGSGDQCTKSCSPNPNFGCQKSRRFAIRETLPVTRMTNQTEPCPPDYSQRGYGPDNPYEQSVYWTLQDNKADTFWSDLLSNTGIPKDKIKFGQYNRGNACAPSAQPGDDCWGDGIDYNIPMPSGYDQGDVSNPKALVQKGLDNANHLGPQLKDTLFALQVTAYQGDAGELIDSISLPILMMVEAVENMFQVAEIADKITEEQRKAIILAFIGAILFFVPVAGEILGAVTELADLASIITILGAAGNTALDVYTIVDDPQNAPLAIMGLVFAPAALADVATITKAANIRRGMKEADIAKLGTKLSSRMKSIKKVTGPCVKNNN